MRTLVYPLQQHTHRKRTNSPPPHTRSSLVHMLSSTMNNESMVAARTMKETMGTLYCSIFSDTKLSADTGIYFGPCSCALFCKECADHPDLVVIEDPDDPNGFLCRVCRTTKINTNFPVLYESKTMASFIEKMNTACDQMVVPEPGEVEGVSLEELLEIDGLREPEVPPENPRPRKNSHAFFLLEAQRELGDDATEADILELVAEKKRRHKAGIATKKRAQLERLLPEMTAVIAKHKMSAKKQKASRLQAQLALRWLLDKIENEGWGSNQDTPVEEQMWEQFPMDNSDSDDSEEDESEDEEDEENEE
jgi:hypothetical protein